MAVELYTPSFICVFFLVILIPVRRVRMSVPHLAMLLWLAGVNFIRGINAIVWDGNAGIRTPVWCDIATKFMLGSNIALPAVFLCISRKLELLGSSRVFATDSKAVRNRRLLELFLCYVVPVIYAGLHPVGQDHRFDLAKDFGCSPSIHNSSFALAFIWIPPLILCSITLAFSFYSIHHTSRVSHSQFVVYIESRTNITSSIFFRQLSTSFVMTAAFIIMFALSIFSAPALVPWSSWDAVHSKLWRINVVTDVDGLNAKRLQWWIFFTVSLLYIVLLFTIGEEARDAFRWVVLQLGKKKRLPKFRDLQLPLFHSRSRGEAAGSSTSNLVAKYPSPLPLTLELKSGWDDMLDTRTARWKFLSRKGTPSPSPPSPTPSKRSSNMDEDKAFMVSTLSYLGSPTAKSLGISPPPHVQSVLHNPSPSPQPMIPQPPRLVLEIPPVPTPPPPSAPGGRAGSPLRIKPIRTDVPPENLEIPPITISVLPPPPISAGAPATSPPRRKPVRVDVPSEHVEIPCRSTSPPRALSPAGAVAVSPIRTKPVRADVPPENVSSVSSVLSKPWPVPPLSGTGSAGTTSPLALAPKTRTRSASRSYSPTSSEGGMHGYTAVTLSNRQLLPIESVSVPSAFDTSPTVRKPLKSALKHPSGKEQFSFQGERLRVVPETT